MNTMKTTLNVLFSLDLQVPCCKESLDGSDVFILDMGLDIYQWNGDTCNKDEKMRVRCLIVV